MVFNLNNKTPGDEGDDEDLSDSEDSVFSGLEDSGSDRTCVVCSGTYVVCSGTSGTCVVCSGTYGDVFGDMCGMFRDLCGVFRDLCGVFRDKCGVFGDIFGVFGDMCGVFRDLCGVFRDIRALCGVFRDVCGMFRDIRALCGVFRDLCGVFRDLCGVFGDMCGLFRDLCGVFRDIRALCGVFRDVCCVSGTCGMFRDIRALCGVFRDRCGVFRDIRALCGVFRDIRALCVFGDLCVCSGTCVVCSGTCVVCSGTSGHCVVSSGTCVDIRNTVGNIPMDWYKDFPHIGYNLDGKKIFKPIRNKDELDEFLDKMDNPDYWRTIHDKQTGSDIILSDDQVALVNRLQRGQFGDLHFNEYQPQVEFFSSDVMLHPVTNRPADKRSFIPSLVEKEKVSKLVHAIKMGWIKPKRHEEAGAGFTTCGPTRTMHLPAPRAPLPGHMESYNPPPEFSSLLQVPAFPRFLHERFERCLDLYLCPRQRKLRVSQSERCVCETANQSTVCVTANQSAVCETAAQCAVPNVCEDHQCIGVTVVWFAPSVCLLQDSGSPQTVQVGGAVKSVAWNPNASLSLLAVALDSMVLVLSPSLADKQIVSASERVLAGPQGAEPAEEAGPVTWTDTEGEELNQGIRLKIQHPKPVQQVAWHAKGDYLASVMPDHSSHLQVFIHQVSRRRSQNPFRKNKGLVQCVSFHPVRPYFFVATQRSVRIYNLVKQEMTKKLQANSKWISSMAVHPGGDHVICGSYDCRLSWFDLDLSTKPYKMLRHHKKAVRGVAYHRLYPLFASASDDGSVIVCHGTVYNDLLQNPLLVPVKVLRGHVITHDLGVLDVTFHPSQPWVFSSGADATIRLFT
ncbi:Ribosome biogenesis protein bop1 [Dissostichus eleginoides]|nr:Ribosome biogenesis protein bop1 [Dissostichus eleginoides]